MLFTSWFSRLSEREGNMDSSYRVATGSEDVYIFTDARIREMQSGSYPYSRVFFFKEIRNTRGVP